MVRSAAGFLAALVVAAGCRNATQASIRPQATDEILLTIDVRDEATPDTTPAVTAFAVHVDARPTQEVLIVPGSGRTSYDALIGPLSGDAHTVEVKPSAYWPPHPGVRVSGVTVRPITPANPHYDLFRLAPAIILRSDTVGASNDLPVLMYVEDRRDAGRLRALRYGEPRRSEAKAGRALRYTTVFTNEDGGTETPALFARWGRACDIEETYEARLDAAGHPIEETFQGPEHEIRPFTGTRIGVHPVLTVATRNNMFLDSGAGGVTIRPVPVVVEPDRRTRESILDERPWLQGLTARELAAEKKPFDPREFVYLEAKLQLRDAAAAAWIERPDGRRATSDRGDDRLTVTRDGWVRVAVPLARGTTVSAAGWSCLPRKDQAGPRRAEAAPAAKARSCHVEPGRVFRLSDDFVVQPLELEVQAPRP